MAHLRKPQNLWQDEMVKKFRVTLTKTGNNEDCALFLSNEMLKWIDAMEERLDLNTKKHLLSLFDKLFQNFKTQKAFA